MSNKKHSKKDRERRRQLEALKAQQKAYRGFSKSDTTGLDIPTESGVLQKSEKYEDTHSLPINLIKKDLLKIIMFVIFSIVFLIFLNESGIDLNALRGFLKV